MSDIIKMDYGMMDEMSQAFQRGAQQLQETMQEMQTIATALEDGALLGRGGAAFVEAIRGKLCPAINKLNNKFDELEKDILQAKQDMQEADVSTERMY